MQVSTTNKSINFLSDRGNDAYFEREVITIKIDAGSAPLINTADSYLTFSVKMDRPSQENGAFLIPDPSIGAIPIESMQIFDGNQNTLCEQMDAVGLYHAFKNYYGNNNNDDNLQAIYEGKGKEFNPEYLPDDNGSTKRKFPLEGGPAQTAPIDAKFPSRGGGFGSQFYQLENVAYNTSPSRKVQVIYRFPMSGLLSAMKSELLPVVVLNGLVIKITLMEGAKFLTLQKMESKKQNTVGSDSIGYATIDEDALTQTFQPQVAPNAHLYQATRTVYSIHGYVDDAGAIQPAGIPADTDITGIVLKATGDAPDGFPLESINNLSIKVGSYIGIGINRHEAGQGGAEAGPAGPVTKIDKRVSAVEINGGRIVLRFPVYETGPVGDDNRANLWASLNNPVVCDLSDLRSDYQITDLQMVCNVVNAPPEYLTGMIKQAQSGQLKIQYNSYRDERINITTGALSNEVFIPTDLQRCYSIFGINERLRAHSVLRSDFTPSRNNLFNYQWIFNGTNVPNIPVDLRRMARNQVSPLQIIELEKAIDESSISLKNIQNPGEFPVIGRRLGAYGQSVSLLDKTVKCRINYENSQNDALLWHFYIYHSKMITFEGNSRVVME